MPRYSQSCTVCGWSGDIYAQPFENPSCPQCGKATERLWAGEATAIERDEIPGGAYFENGFAEPRKFFSHSEHERALAEEGCELRPMNRGDRDKICPRWDQPCEATLESARILLSRGAQAASERNARRNRWPQAVPGMVTVTDGDTFTMKRD